VRLRRSGNDLILKVAGTSDALTFSDWYLNTGNKTFKTLQFIVDSTLDYSAGSSDVLRNKKVVQLNFGNLVKAFDAALSANPALGDWAVPSATLAAMYVGGSDTQALGGSLAYRYGHEGGLSGIELTTANATLADAAFGMSAQTFAAQAAAAAVTQQALATAFAAQDSSAQIVSTGRVDLLGGGDASVNGAKRTPWLTAADFAAAEDQMEQHLSEQRLKSAPAATENTAQDAFVQAAYQHEMQHAWASMHARLDQALKQPAPALLGDESFNGNVSIGLVTQALLAAGGKENREGAGTHQMKRAS